MIHLMRVTSIKFGFLCLCGKTNFTETRPDTRLPQSRVGGQGPYLRSLDHLGRSSEAKDRKKKKVKCDGWTNEQTEGRTDRRTDKAGGRVA